MLKTRSKAPTTPKKQALMADSTSQPSSTEKYRKPISSSLFLSSPRLFTSFASKGGFSETEAAMSPTSILDSKPFSYNLKNPLFSDPKAPSDPEISAASARHRPWDKRLGIGIGLGIVDALNDEKSDRKQSNSETRMVLFGSHLKIQIPDPLSSGDFGTKTRNSHLGFSPGERSGAETPISPRVFTDMELSEDYTCVITHGPNPKTTHIFDDCIVEEGFCGVVGLSGARKEEINDNIGVLDNGFFPSENFLSFCCTCKKNLEQGKDIYMYRGEKAFCSHECRFEEMMLEERADKLD
ncbi:hypothetical protein TIFTF001_015908 [Ficus carica]|uniref:FLZ-type domain-containing protein n=1 Tax=Ficus carica TaxID=3494 RepID=A0AA88A9M3_FICCA|nr:hypothetical protein TIFTF001_015908 [Ficus carica]